MLWVIGSPAGSSSGFKSGKIKIFRRSTLIESGYITSVNGVIQNEAAFSWDGSHTTNQRFRVTFTDRDSGFVFRGMLAVFVAKR